MFDSVRLLVQVIGAPLVLPNKKKTDKPVTQDDLETLKKFKGHCALLYTLHHAQGTTGGAAVCCCRVPLQVLGISDIYHLGYHCELQRKVRHWAAELATYHFCKQNARARELCRFLTDSRHFWLGCTKLPCDFPISQGLQLLYCAEMGYYLQVTLPAAQVQLALQIAVFQMTVLCCIHRGFPV